MRTGVILTGICLLCVSIMVVNRGCQSARQARIESRNKWINATISRIEAGQTDVALYSCINTDLLLEKIAGMPQVESVFFQQTIDLTDDGLQFLQTLPSLKRLEFDHEKSVTNKSLEIVSKCKQLNFLSLKGTRVTDAGLDIISKMTQLEAFDHYGQFSPAAIESLSKKFPTLKIVDRDAYLRSLNPTNVSSSPTTKLQIPYEEK